MGGSLPEKSAALRQDFPDGIRLELDLNSHELAADEATQARYPVFLVDRPAKMLANLLGARQQDLHLSDPPRMVCLCDEYTAEAFGIQVESQLITSGWQVDALTVPAGEQSKTLATVEQVCEALSALGAGRNTVLCSLGGGVISDLAAFVAGIYNRGMYLVHIPTTLVGMVDAAIGGKAAVNLPTIKNKIGLFKHPLAIVGDPEMLASLPDDQYASGLAEAAKTALLAGEPFLGWLEEHTTALLERDPATLRELIARCIEFKAGVVASDPREEAVPSPRMSLNYGHSLGHVIEAVTSLDPDAEAIPHGIAVAQGMRFAARLALQLVGASRAFVQRQDALLDALGLAPIDPACMGTDLTALRDIFYRDKKTYDAQLRFVLLSEPGKADIVTLPEELLYDHLRAWLDIPLVVGRVSGKYAKAADDTETETEDEASHS